MQKLSLVIRKIIFINLVIPLSFSYAGDLSDNNVSITVSADTLVIRSFEDDFKIIDSNVDAGLPYSTYDNYGLEGSVIVNSVAVNCITVFDCGTGKSFSINTNDNVTLVGEGIINSIIIIK